MDRREALKKLGVGGAIVLASPVIVPSFRVAHAASGDPPSDPPDPNTPGVIVVDDTQGASNHGYDLTISPDAVSCGPGSVTTVDVAWQITQYGGNTNKPLQVVNAADDTVIVSAVAGAVPTALVPGSNSVVIKRGHQSGSTSNLTFTIVAHVTWYCGTSSVFAVYQFQKLQSNRPALTINFG